MRNTQVCHKYALWGTAVKLYQQENFLKFWYLLLLGYEVIDQVSVKSPESMKMKVEK